MWTTQRKQQTKRNMIPILDDYTTEATNKTKYDLNSRWLQIPGEMPT